MMTSFKVHTLSALAVAIFLTTPLGQAEAAKQPNILIVIADDLNKDSVGVYGSKDVKTPNIDRLAGQGMQFNLAYTSTAMCAPTRQQLYTGLYPVRSGAYPNHSKVKPGTKSLVHYLKALGYRVGLSGKRHFGPPSSFRLSRFRGRWIPPQSGSLLRATRSSHSVCWSRLAARMFRGPQAMHRSTTRPS